MPDLSRRHVPFHFEKPSLIELAAPQRHRYNVTGPVVNPYAVPVRSLWVTTLIRDGNGVPRGGGSAQVKDPLAPGGPTLPGGLRSPGARSRFRVRDALRAAPGAADLAIEIVTIDVDPPWHVLGESSLGQGDAQRI
ncbi:hypothetical protein K8Z49_22950 [Actinomadura madurae]|uniref:hypothetical protein n=1 Tax=Actinomadura madurae TaxID=1993 RepID=UPI00399BD7E9